MRERDRDRLAHQRGSSSSSSHHGQGTLPDSSLLKVGSGVFMETFSASIVTI